MFKPKRTAQEILDDFKKIDGRESQINFTNKIEALVNEWIENKYDPNIIFKFSDNFERKDVKGDYLPKEITIADWLITMKGAEGQKTMLDERLNPHVTCSSGRTTLMLVCQSRERFWDNGVKGYIKYCLTLGMDKNAVDDTGKTALDYLLITAHCKSRLQLEQKKPELKEVLKGFLTAEEIMTGKKADPIDLKERIGQLEQELVQVKAENLQLKQENAQLRQERSGPASTRLSEIEISKKEPRARRS